MNNDRLKNSLYTLSQLTTRNIKLFLKDKANVFFSLLAPLIILLLYVLFLGDVQLNSITSQIPQGVAVNSKAIKAFVDSWMIAGVLSVACITVSLGANIVLVDDKARGKMNDCLSSPIPKWVITLSYFLYNFIVTCIIVLLVYAVCMVFLATNGSWYISIGKLIGVVGIIALSSLSATVITVFICGLFSSEAQHGAFVGIASAILGFLIGAYMPMSMMPKAAQYISAIVPGSHSAGLFRQLLMSGALDNLAEVLPQQVVNSISNAFSMELNFWGKNIGVSAMLIYLSASVVVFVILNLIFAFRKKRKN